MATPTTTVCLIENDAQILADLQTLETTVAVTGYQTVNGTPTITWADIPGAEDFNTVLGYFQANNQLRSFIQG